MDIGAQLFADPSWQNGFKLLCDYRAASDFNPNVSELQNLVNQDRKLRPTFDKSLCAILVASDSIFDIARVWQMMSEDSIVKSCVFKELGQALKWLGIGAESYERMENHINTMRAI
jgi:hypothetical protein